MKFIFGNNGFFKKKSSFRNNVKWKLTEYNNCQPTKALKPQGMCRVC